MCNDARHEAVERMSAITADMVGMDLELIQAETIEQRKAIVAKVLGQSAANSSLVYNRVPANGLRKYRHFLEPSFFDGLSD